MATLCTHCGKALKDGARFCNTCGTLVPSHPLSPKSTSSPASPIDRNDNTRVVMREQIAQQPPYPPARSRNDPPAWMSQLNNGRRHQSPEASAGLPTNLHEKSPDLRRRDRQVPDSMERSNSAAHEVRREVWEQEEPAIPHPPMGKWLHGGENSVEDLPTSPLVAGSPDLLRQRSSLSPPAPNKQDARFDDVEHLDTLPLTTHMGMKTRSQSANEPAQEWDAPRQQQSIEHPTYPPAYLQPVRDHTRISSASGAQDTRQTPPPQFSVSPSRRRKPLVIVLVSLLLLVILGGVGAWIILYQPFSVASVTQPQQSFKDTQLGLSLLYPNGWNVQVDHSKARVNFYDSSHTAQVTIVVASQNGGDLDAYLQQEATQLNITGQKPGPSLSFAGISWRQLQGNVQQSGASYTETLLATVHNTRLFTIMFLAPQPTYVQEDQIVFSGMRSSLQFET